MKRILSVLVLLFLSYSLAYAVSPVTITNPDGSIEQIVRTADLTVVNDATIINSTTAVSSPWQYIGDCQKVGFIVGYAENSTDNAMNISVNMSATDSGVGFPAQFYDFAGGATAQTIQPFTGNSTYYFWLSTDISVPFVKIDYAANAADNYNFTTVTVKMSTLK